jgi:myosin-1
MEEIVVQAPPPPPPVATRPVPSLQNGMNGAAAKSKPGPPVPPTKRPAGKKAVPLANERDSGYSGSGASARDSGGSVAGNLAEALRQRQAAMHSRKNDDDDW